MPGKKKLALMGFFASRDQFAKYILLRKRESYHIWLDERNMAKAITHAFALNKVKVEVKQSKTKTKEYEGPTAEELNRQMAERQRKGISILSEFCSLFCKGKNMNINSKKNSKLSMRDQKRLILKLRTRKVFSKKMQRQLLQF